MTLDQIRAVLKERASEFSVNGNREQQRTMAAYLHGQAKGAADALNLLEPQVLDGESGTCPKCGGRMGSRLPDGRWRCHGLSSYAVLASENCGHVYQD